MGSGLGACPELDTGVKPDNDKIKVLRIRNVRYVRQKMYAPVHKIS
jgi:hypothetical protein